RISNGKEKIMYNPDAIAFHSKKTWNRIKDVIKRFFSYGRADCYLIRKHPKRTMFDGPTPLVALMIFCLLIIFKMFVSKSLDNSLLIFRWILFFLISYAIWNLLFKSLKNAIKTVSSIFLLSVIDMGRVYEGLRKLEPRVFYRKFIFTRMQLSHEWNDIMGSVLSCVFAFFLSVM
ncbi:MAG: hypothetical protein ACFFCQ_17790, partial [Promethearchaeota archaeon]